MTPCKPKSQQWTGIGKPIVTPLLQRLLHRPPSILYFCSTQQTPKQLLSMPPEHTRENTTWQSPVASQIFCKHPPYSQKHSPQHICRLLRGIKAHIGIPLSHTASTKLLPRKCGHQWLSKLAPRQPNTSKYYKTGPRHPGNNIIGAEGISTCQEPYARAGCQRHANAPSNIIHVQNLRGIFVVQSKPCWLCIRTIRKPTPLPPSPAGPHALQVSIPSCCFDAFGTSVVPNAPASAVDLLTCSATTREAPGPPSTRNFFKYTSSELNAMMTGKLS